MTSQGSSYSRFQRALTTGNLHIIRAAAAELPHIELEDAARICAVIAERRPDRLDAAGTRWIHRLCTERDPDLGTVEAATRALTQMRNSSQEGLHALVMISRQ